MIQKIIQNIKEEIQSFYLSHREKSILVTLIVLIFILLTCIVLSLKPSEKEVLLTIEFPKEEISEIQEQPQENQAVNATTNAFNQADNNLKHSIEPLKTLDELLQEQNSQDATNSQKNASDEDEINSDDTKKETKTEKEIAQKDYNATKKPEEFANKNSFIKYELIGRKAVRDLPNPIYTCESSGKIVINISVNHLGEVIETSFNESASNSKDNCLIDNALYYAKQARFSISDKKKQLGSITYFFQSK